MNTPSLQKRTHCYIQPPKAYGMAPCECGKEDTAWSEFKDHLWCEVCKKDFIPAHAGVFDGPIPVQAAAMMGIRFDRVDLATSRIERFDIERGCYVDEADVSAEPKRDGATLRL